MTIVEDRLISPAAEEPDYEVNKDVELFSSEDKDKDKDGGREEWIDSTQFFFTVLGFCVGLGNIWRFPYLCQQNGGGAFIFPFLIMILLEGMPLMLLELGIGQKMRKGSYIVWNRIHPALGGIGLGSTVIAIVVGCYYQVIIAWCLYYLANSFAWPNLPWSSCPNNRTLECIGTSETQYFWYREALDISPSIDETGGFKWWMLLCLVSSWIAIYVIIMKGIESSAKVVYFTALFPYLVLSIFLVRGVTLKGAWAGLAHMFYPKLDKLLEPSVWLDAANQVFYSFGLAFGSIIGFGSYNPKKKNCVFDVYAISACNAFTAIFGCAVVFAILGFKAQHLFEKCIEHDLLIMNLNYSQFNEQDYLDLMSKASAANFTGLKNCTLEAELDQAAQGTGLAFIVMADVFTMLPGAPFWSVLFFSMLLALGLGSQIGILEGLLGTLFDMPQLKGLKKPISSGAACLFCLLVGLIFATGAGEYWVSYFDKFGAMGLAFIAFFEIVAVVYVYGHERFTQDIREMTGINPGWYWQITWRFIAPVLIAGILLASIVQQLLVLPTYNAWNASEAETVETQYPSWTLALAALLALSSVLPVAIVAVLNLVFKVNLLGSKEKAYAVINKNNLEESPHTSIVKA